MARQNVASDTDRTLAHMAHARAIVLWPVIAGMLRLPVIIDPRQCQRNGAVRCAEIKSTLSVERCGILRSMLSVSETGDRIATPTLHRFDSMLNHTPGHLVWCYVPNDDGDGWEPPYVCQPVLGEIDGDVFIDAADAHRCARILREHFHGHLFAVLHTSQTPNLTR